ncbi:MAG: DUF998 domain-containing protein [Actinobacteria bacterium]|nr:MAG: DUF998 domain-containing protein [Actinomycetota bacterium]
MRFPNAGILLDVLRRAAGVCGVLALITETVGWVAGGLAQSGPYSSAADDTSYLGALTAHNAWVFNQIGDNLTGILVVVVGVAFWLALTPSIVGRIGAGALVLAGIGAFLDGLFRLDCRGSVAGCRNDSWHASAHKMETRFTVVATFAAPLLLAFAFRRLAEWRDVWLPTLLAVPVAIVAGVLFSFVGDGAATRATTTTWFVWLAFVSIRLSRAAMRASPAASAG